MPETTQARRLALAAVGGDHRGAHLGAAPDERVVVADAVHLEALPGVLLDPDPGRGGLRGGSRKWSPRVSPNCSGELTPFSLANAKAVFFWVSVGSTSPGRR